MPGHEKRGTGEPDPDPTPFLFISFEEKQKVKYFVLRKIISNIRIWDLIYKMTLDPIFVHFQVEPYPTDLDPPVKI